MIDDDKLLTPEAKKVNYFKIIQLTLFAKGFAYRFDLDGGQVVGPDGKKDEERTKILAKLPSGEIMFATNTYLYGIYKAAINDPKKLEQAILNQHNQKNPQNKIQFVSDMTQNVQIVEMSSLPPVEKAWLISYAKKPESVEMKRQDLKVAK